MPATAETVRKIQKATATIVPSSELKMCIPSPVQANGLKGEMRAGGRMDATADSLLFLDGFPVRGRVRFDESMRQMVRRHLDEIAVERREQLPILRFVRGLGLAAASGPLESGPLAAA